MSTCANCGANYPDERDACPRCGAPAPAVYDDYPENYSEEYDAAYDAAPEQNYSDTQYDRADGYRSAYGQGGPAYDRGQPPRGYPGTGEPAYRYAPPRDDAVLSTGAFVGSLALLAIPIIGFIIQIIWAVGGAKNRNRRNLARAYLVLSIVGLLFTLATAFALYYLFAPYIGEFTGLLEML